MGTFSAMTDSWLHLLYAEKFDVEILLTQFVGVSFNVGTQSLLNLYIQILEMTAIRLWLWTQWQIWAISMTGFIKVFYSTDILGHILKHLRARIHCELSILEICFWLLLVNVIKWNWWFTSIELDLLFSISILSLLETMRRWWISVRWWSLFRFDQT